MATFDFIFEKELDGLMISVHGGAQQNPTGLKNPTEASENAPVHSGPVQTTNKVPNRADSDYSVSFKIQ